MLQTKTISINLNATIKVGDTKVVDIYKMINADGSYGNAAQTIIDTELYAANMTQCREDRQKFESMCMDIQDKLIDGSLLDGPLENKEEQHVYGLEGLT